MWVPSDQINKQTATWYLVVYFLLSFQMELLEPRPEGVGAH